MRYLSTYLDRIKISNGIFERKEYPVGTKVICINDKPSFQGAPIFIKKGEIYEIEDINIDGDSYKLKDVKLWYLTNRFISELEYIAKKYNL